jgi:hypothetical protein
MEATGSSKTLAHSCHTTRRHTPFTQTLTDADVRVSYIANGHRDEVMNRFLLLMLQSFDWLAAFRLDLLQAILFITVQLSDAVFLATCFRYRSRGLPTAFFPPSRMFTTNSLCPIICPIDKWGLFFNPLNAEPYPIYHMLASLAHHILHVSR